MKKAGYIVSSLLVLVMLISACSMQSKQETMELDVAQETSTATMEVTLSSITLDNSASDFTYYDTEVQETIQSMIDAYKANGASFEEPLVIMNPYGTNTTGLYIYFTDETQGKLRVSISAAGYATYVNDYDTEAETQHEHQIIGLVGGVENTVTLTYLGDDDIVIKEESFTIDAPALASGMTQQIDVSYGTSTETLSDGLYAALGLNFTYDGYTFLIDNDGVVRAEICFDSDMNETLEFYEDCMLINYDETHMALINGLGKVVSTYDLNEFAIHHDYEINSDGKAVILVSDTTKDSVEDVIATLDLETGEVTTLVDFDELMGDYKEQTQSFTEDGVWGSYGDSSWDWLHFNTIELVGEDEMIVSSRETSTIMKLSNIYDDITIDYFIADESIWEDTSYAKYLLEQDGSFTNSAGQHTVTYVESDELEDGQYYLYMFNNNFWSYESRIESDANVAGASNELYAGTASYYTCYLVDENEGTYSLVECFAVPYSSIVSSTQWVGNNLIVNSGLMKSFNVYDENQELIASYSYDNEYLFQGYRVLKYDFINYWFA